MRTVSDRPRRCCAPCRNIIGYKSILNCHACASWFLHSVLLGAIQGEISLFLILSESLNDSVLFGTCNQVQLSIYVSSVFSPMRFSASLRLCGGFSAEPKLLFTTFDRRVICTTIQKHQRLRQRRVVDTVFRHLNNFIILTFKRHNFTDQVVS